MIRNFEWQIACCYLITKRKDSFISVINALSLIGIALGVSVLIVVMSVMRGYEVELVKRILGINGYITVVATNHQLMQADDNLNHAISNITDVRFAAPIIIDHTMILGSNVTGASVRGMDGYDLEKKPIMADSLVYGSFDEYNANNGIFIGISLAAQLKISVGDSIKLVAPKLDNLVIGSIPRAKTFKIVGIFDVGMQEYNSTTIFMPMKLATVFFGTGGKISGIEVVLNDHTELKDVRNKLSELIQKQNMPLSIVDCTTQNESLIAALRVERNVMFFILSLIIMIAAFNIITSLTMLVNDKQTSIAIFKTIGMSSSSIIKIFMICGSMIGFIGAISGCILGVLFSLNIERIRAFLESLTGVTLFDPVIYFLTSLPSELSINNVLITLSIALSISIIATIYPALKAAKLSPIEILRSK